MANKFNNTNKQNRGTGNVKSVAPISVMRSEVLSKVSVPMYFYNIIIPQLPGYFDLYPVNFDADPRACCPLHDEDTPSFRYYENTASFYCFGCQKGGNVINLHQYFAEKMNGRRPDKDEAIAFLYQYFIQGHESETFIDVSQKTIDKKERYNTDKEVVKFNLYRFNLEQAISFDSNIKLDAKEQLWKVLDDIDMLLAKDLIKVDSAEEYIKKKVKEIIGIDASVREHKKITFDNTKADMKYIRKK